MARHVQETVTGRVDRLRQRYQEFYRELTDRQQALLRALTFLTKFTALAAPFWLVLQSGWHGDGVRSLTAQAAAVVLRTVGMEVAVTGSMVDAGTLLVDVTRDSTGWKSVMVFLALVAASRRPVRSKAAAAVAGTAALLVLNLVRIVSMVYAVVVFGVEYELLHMVLWRWGLTAGVIAVWTVWLWFSGTSQRIFWP